MNKIASPFVFHLGPSVSVPIQTPTPPPHIQQQYNPFFQFGSFEYAADARVRFQLACSHGDMAVAMDTFTTFNALLTVEVLYIGFAAACQHGHLVLADFIRRKTVDKQMTSMGNDLALRMALKSCNIEAVKYVMRTRTSPDKEYNLGAYAKAVQWAFLDKCFDKTTNTTTTTTLKKKKKEFWFLLNLEPSIFYIPCLLTSLASIGQLDTICILLSINPEQYNADIPSAFVAACRYGHEAIVKHFIENHQFVPDLLLRGVIAANEGIHTELSTFIQSQL